jgi:hypothetical protein
MIYNKYHRREGDEIYHPRKAIRWRHRFCIGKEDDWKWHLEMLKPEDFKNIVLELNEEYHWSDHYRGIEWEYAMIPDDVIQSRIDKCKEAIKVNETNIMELQKLLEIKPED